MRYLVKVNELEKKIDYLKKQLDIISESITNLEKEKEQLDWQGFAHETFLKKYNLNMTKLKQIEQSTVNCLSFFIQYYDKYGDIYKEFKNKYSRDLITEVKNGLSKI